MKFSTKAVHAGQNQDLSVNAVIPPIFMTSTYAQNELGKHAKFSYGRSQNMNRLQLEENIAELEEGKYGLAFSSGVAAIHSISGLLSPGDNIVVSDDVYGGTFRIFDKVFSKSNISLTWVDFSSTKNLENSISEKTKIIFIETPTNPLLKLIDIKFIAKVCKKNNLLLVVDNTFMTPYFQQPMKMGADIVIHSSTKYLNGHSDVIGGLVVVNDEQIFKKLKFIQNSVGAVPSPFDCWLVLRAIKTLPLRMEKHNQNALQIAKYLSVHPKVKKIFYPGLKSHPQYGLASKQMSGFGGVVTIELENISAVKRFFKRLRIFTLAESLGGVESLVNHPSTMSHSAMTEIQRSKLGIKNTTIRISVGIEDIEDLINDLENSLK